MKRYSISTVTPTHYDRYQYEGRTDNPEEVIEKYKNDTFLAGIRIVDSKTKDVVFQDKRALKGELIVTFNDGKDEWTCKDKFVNLQRMREYEHNYKYGYTNRFNPKMKVVKVERVIY